MQTLKAEKKSISSNNDQELVNLLEIEDLSVHLGGNQILKNINMVVKKGHIHAVIGPNGAGKTTLMRSIMGGMPHQGIIRFLFRSNSKIGYVPQLLEFDHSVPITVCDFVSIMLQDKPIFLSGSGSIRKKIVETLAITESEHLIDRLIGGLSGGEFRRVLLAQALEPLPEILLLDEPASNIDEYGAMLFEQMLNRLREEHGLTILMVGHDIKMILRMADRVTSINRRVMFDGTPDELQGPGKVDELFNGSMAISTENMEG
ncbi:MAG: metal ABC transporter ATP-binding protein [Desulfobulbaceae bacterium]|nr:metal ABC transporter ATP-binding protein [Desulfobulbaceae bacterium]